MLVDGNDAQIVPLVWPDSLVDEFVEKFMQKSDENGGTFEHGQHGSWNAVGTGRLVTLLAF